MSSRRVHIATGAPLAKPGGLHRYVRDLAAGQVALGHQVTVIERVRRSGSYSVSEQFGTPEPLDLDRGDVLHFHFAVSALPVLLRWWRPLRGVQRVFHFHGPWASEGHVQGDSVTRVAVKRLIERLAYRSFDCFTCDSQAFRQVLVEDYGIPEDRVTTVLPGVDFPYFAAGAEPGVARQGLGLWPDGRLLGTVRRLEPRMGIDLLIDALAESSPTTNLAIAGTGSVQSQLERAVETRGLQGRVRFVGRLSDAELVDFYSAIDGLVVPTRALEGFGLVVLEAMSAGTPVIASNCGGLPEAMGPFAADWTFPIDDKRALIAKLNELEVRAPSSSALREYARSMDRVAFAQRVEAILVGEYR